MGIRITPEALAVIRNSLQLAGLDPSETGVRLRVAGGEIRPRFAPTPQETDEVVEVEGIRVFVDTRALEGMEEAEIGVTEEHETLVVREAGA